MSTPQGHCAPRSATIATLIGTRPQLVKASVVSEAVRSIPGIREILIDTGQHYDAGMSDVFYEELGIPRPDAVLGVGSGPHGRQTARMLESFEEWLTRTVPDFVMVYGDTNSTLAGVLAASKLGIPVAHVEAGLRSYNRRMPEEQNRLVADHLSDALFAPTDHARRNLLREGIGLERIHVVGDVMLDAARKYGVQAASRSRVLQRLNVRPQEYVLATIHRAENTNDADRLRAIFAGLSAVSQKLPVVLPLHPRTRSVVADLGLTLPGDERLIVVDPVGYLDMVALERAAGVIVTDSGGVQKEAYFHRVYCVTIRDETEWTELVEYGYNVLVETDAKMVADAVLSRFGRTWVDGPDLYGDGAASHRIAGIMADMMDLPHPEQRELNVPLHH